MTTSTIRHLTIDSRSPFHLSRFWGAALGFAELPEDPNLPDDDEALLRDPNGRSPDLLFVTVPDAKAVKNRLHLDLQPLLPREAEVARLLDLGASLVDDRRRPDGTGWAVLADPEGNEFCVERSAAERGEPGRTDLGRRPQPPLHTSGEREMLEAMLEWYRAGVLHKVRGVDAALAAATPLASATSIAGLVKHLAMVEDSWWAVDFAGEAEAEWYRGVDWDADPDWEFRTAVDEPLEVNLARYEVALERCRRIADGRGLDDIGADTSRREFSLRFVYLHLIEETARHLGHLDVLRELLDGTTGD